MIIIFTLSFKKVFWRSFSHIFLWKKTIEVSAQVVLLRFIAMLFPKGDKAIGKFIESYRVVYLIDHFLQRCPESKAIVPALNKACLMCRILNGVGKCQYLSVSVSCDIQIGGQCLAYGNRAQSGYFGADDCHRVGTVATGAGMVGPVVFQFSQCLYGETLFFITHSFESLRINIILQKSLRIIAGSLKIGRREFSTG